MGPISQVAKDVFKDVFEDVFGDVIEDVFKDVFGDVFDGGSKDGLVCVDILLVGKIW